MRRVLWVSLIVMTLAACSRQPENSPKAGEKPAPEISAEEASSWEAEALASFKASRDMVSAADARVPVLKTGLWQVIYQRPEMGFSETRKICVDEGLAARLAELPASQDAVDCRKHDVTPDGDAVRVETVCTRNDTTLTSHIVIRAPNENEFHQTMETLYDPAFAGHADAHMTADGKYLGACPVGK